MTMSSPRARLGAVVAVVFLLAVNAVSSAPRAMAEPLGECAQPPQPERVSAGMTGAIDPTHGQGLAGSIYLKYGYAGQVWHVFDAAEGPLTMCAAPVAEFTTMVGNFLFDGAKVLVALANSTHYLVYEGGLASTFDHAIKVGAQAAYEGFAVPFLALALLAVGIGVFWYVMRGDNSGVAKSAGRVAAGLTLVAASAFSPLVYTNLFDDLIIGGFKQAQQKMYSALPGISEDTVYRHVLPTTLHREIVYKNWLRGEFGDVDSELAKKLGEDLVWAQACSWSEVRSDSCDVQAKQQRFKEIAQTIKAKGNYATFTGSDGTRVGIGALALFEASIITPLQIVSKLGILLAQLVLRVVVLFGPVLGILAMAPGVARRILKGVLGVGALGLFLTIVASLHSYIVVQILNASMPLMAKLVVISLITLLIWAVARPVKRVKSMMASSMYAMPGQGLHRAADWLQHSRMMHALKKPRHRRQRHSHFDRDFWLSRDDVAMPPESGRDDDAPGTVYATATRPEASAGTPQSLVAPAALPGTHRPASGSNGSGDGNAGSPPRGPHGDAPSGTGVAATPPAGVDPLDEAPQPAPIRAEATRLDEPDTAPQDNVAGNTRPGTLSASPHRLPPGTGEDDRTQPHPTEDRSELVTGSDVLSGDQPGDDTPPQTRQTDDNGGTGSSTNTMYRASNGQVEPDPGSPTSGQRPEVPDGSEQPPHDNPGESNADPH